MSGATVIVPTALGGERLVRLLDSLDLDDAGARAIVVDNASGDPGVARLAERPAVDVIRLDRNEGFSRAVNVAARAAVGETLVLLNDDCVCDPGFVDAISAALDPRAGVVMAAGVMRDAADPSLIDSAGMELDRTLLVFDYLNGEPVSRLAAGVPDPVGPSAAAAAFDRSAFLDAGGFDEGLFAYWEDVDLVLRLREAGGRCALAAGATGVHEHSATLGSGSKRKNWLMGFGRGYVLRRWGVMRSPVRVAAVLARDLALCAGQAVVDRNVAGVRGRLAGWRASRRSYDFPAAAPSHHAPGVFATLRRRAARRARLARRRPAEVAGRDLRALFVFHLAEVSGPARCLEPAIELLSGGPATFALPGPGPMRAELDGRGSVVELAYRPLTWPRGPLGPLRGLARLVREVATFRRLIREREPDVVVVATSMLPAPLVAARLAGVPAVAYVAELPARSREPSDGRELAGRMTAALVARTAGAVVACSRAVAKPYAGRRGLETVTVYPPISDRYAHGDGAAFRRRHGVPDGVPLVVSVGAITRGRGQDVLVHAASRLRDRLGEVRVVILGEPYRRPPDLAFASELRDLIAKLELENVARLGGFEDRVEDAYAAADVFVNPARFEEPFGRAAFEALLAGTPVVSTDVGAVSELLRDTENALLVEREDAAGMADAIERLLDDPGMGRTLAAQGAEVARERLRPALARERWAEVLGEVLGRRL